MKEFLLPPLCDSYDHRPPTGRSFSLGKRKKLKFQRLADVPPAERLKAARELVAADPHMPASERRELLERAIKPSASGGGWIEDEDAAS